MPASDDPSAVAAFWRAAGEEAWFAKDPAFDARFRARFIDAHFAAARRERDAWALTAGGALSLVLLLDQFPRNAFRGCGHMYATDGLARHFADRAITEGHDLVVEPALRVFFYLPFAHSENPADQQRSVTLHAGLGDEPLEHAHGHRAIIARFGRFPHRNRLLGRETTAEERAFLDAGGFSG